MVPYFLTLHNTKDVGVETQGGLNNRIQYRHMKHKFTHEDVFDRSSVWNDGALRGK